MFQKIKSLLSRRPKYTRIGLGAVLAAAIIAAVSFSLGNREDGLPLAGSITPTPTDQPASTPEPSPSATPKDVPVPVPSPAVNPFTYAICPPDIVKNPFETAKLASGFKPAEEPASPPLEHIRAISTGHVSDEAGYGMEFGASYALAEDGALYHWGYSGWESGKRPSAFPQRELGIPDAIQQVDGKFVLTETGEVYLLQDSAAARKIEGLSGTVAIAQSRESDVYVIDKSGNIKLYALYGSEGTPKTSVLSALGKVKSISASPFIALGTAEDGKLVRLNAMDNGVNPVELPAGERVERIFTTMSYTKPGYILTDKSHWYAFNVEGKLERAAVPDGTVQVTATERNTVALKADGTVWVWGDAGNLLPEGIPVTPEKALQLSGFSGVASIAAGQSHLLALTKDGHVLSAGSNMYGQLGWESIYADDPQPIGVWRGLESMFSVYNHLFVIAQGNVWSLDGNNAVKPILLGQKAKKAFAGLGHYAILTKRGQLIVSDPDETKPCRLLQAPSPIVDATATTNGIVLALQDGRVFLGEGNTTAVEIKTEMRLDPKPAGKVTQVFGEAVPVVLTDQGELYVRERTENGMPILKPVKNLNAPIVQWSPMHYVYTDGFDYIGKALDRNNRVYEVTLRLSSNGDPAKEMVSVSIKPNAQPADMLTGGAVIGPDGRIEEQFYNSTIQTNLPKGIQIHAATSMYHLPMEGRSYFYHVFAAEDGTIYWLGDLPHIGPYVTAKPVTAPR